MPWVEIDRLPVIERLPGWRGGYFRSLNMTFAHYDFVRSSSIHEHVHPQEEVYEVLEGEREVFVDGVPHIARAGLVVIVPPGVRHSRQSPQRRAGNDRRPSGQTRFRVIPLWEAALRFVFILERQFRSCFL